MSVERQRGGDTERDTAEGPKSAGAAASPDDIRVDDVPGVLAADRDVARTLGLDRRGRIKRWVRRLVWLAVIAAVVLGGLRLWRNLNAPKPIQYRTEPVERGDLLLTVTATGNLEPENVVDLGPEISGLVRRVLVDFNDEVAAGQVLAELDRSLLEARVSEARAQRSIARAARSEAEAILAEAQVNRDRVARLRDRDLASTQERDAADTTVLRAEAALDTARAQVRAADAALRMAETNLEKAAIRSPIDGIVLTRMVEEGQTVVSEFQSAVLFRIAGDLRHMELHVDVDEADVGRVRPGQDATFTVAAYPDREFAARLVAVRNAPLTVSNVVTYRAVLEVDNQELLLRPGMTATAEIVIGVLEDRLLVPNAALRFSPPESEMGSGLGTGDATPAEGSRVWILDGGQPRSIPIETGPTNGIMTVVENGALEPGTSVLVDVIEPEGRR